jgi:type I restriction enzyme S subunit
MNTATIGNIAEQVRGVSYAKADATDAPKPGFSPILRANNIGENGLNFDSLVYVPDSKIKEKQRIRPGDVVIAASSGSLDVVGKAARAMKPFEGAFGAFCKVLRPSEKVDSGYFAHFFKTRAYRQRISSLAAGANINNLKNEHLDDLEIPLPPLTEQKRIAAILDAADDLRTKRRESLAQLDTLLQSTFLDLFGDPVTNPKGWKVCDADDIATRITVGVVVKPASYYVPNGVPALRSLNVRENRISTDDLVYFSNKDNEKNLQKSRIWAGDILLVRSGKPGTAAVVPEELDGSNAIDILIFSPNREMIDPSYLCYYFNSSGGRRMALGEQRGQIQQHLNVGSLKKASIPVPPLKQQEKFSNFVAETERQRDRLTSQLEKLDTLFASLQSRAFRGEL